ncbi:Alpha,alpha-trehalose-phosphate synthase [UDP-forming], partial [Dictyocoela roeselum]
LGVDRTDYIKGIPNRIEGYNRALSKYPELVDTSVFIQIGVPSRENVNGYRDLVTNIKTAIADLNSAHGPADSTLAHFLYSSVPFDELCALYAAADVCLVSSLVDGMNLVSMEFISCQEERQGVLILSEFAGSLSTLPGSIKINPYDLDEIADSIKQALEMGPEERKRRFEMNFRGVKKFDGIYWAEENLKLLRE